MNRDEIAKIVYRAMEWACANNTGNLAPSWVDGGNSHAQTEARSQADAILATYPALGEQGFEEWWNGPTIFTDGNPRNETSMEEIYRTVWSNPCVDDYFRKTFTAGHATVTVLPLKWKGCFAHNGMGGYYHATGEPGDNVLKYHTGSSETGIGVFDTLADLEAAAFTHHEALIRSQIGGA